MGWSRIQHRITSQITGMGASVFTLVALVWLPETRYPAFASAERKSSAGRGEHLSVDVMPCKSTAKGQSNNSSSTVESNPCTL